jgi:hypothetical protein
MLPVEVTMKTFGAVEAKFHPLLIIQRISAFMNFNNPN